jgi:DNA-binding transcriptional LysR family regulator
MQVKPPAPRRAHQTPRRAGPAQRHGPAPAAGVQGVVECGGMSAAELELNIGTSTVSRHMKDLETRLGLTLCRRGRAGLRSRPRASACTTRRCACWPPWTAFAAASTTSTAAWAGAADVAVFDKTASNPAAHIGEPLRCFAARRPRWQLHLHVGSHPGDRARRDGRQLPVGIIPAHRTSQSLATTDLFGETMLLYCGARHPLFGRSTRADLGAPARLPVCRAGLPLAQHGAEPPRAPAAQGHRV